MSQAIAMSHVSDFAPVDLGGCVMDLDPDVACIVDGDNKVQQCTDLSGAGNHATQVTAGGRPAYGALLNGRRVVTFNGSTWLTHGLTRGVGTYFIVGGYTGGPAAVQALASFAAGGGGTYWWARTGGASWGGTFGGDLSDSTPAYTPTLVSARVTGYNNVELRTNGTRRTLTSGTGWSSVGSAIGAANGAGTAPLTGVVARVIAFDRVLSAAECAVVEDYLLRRYSHGMPNLASKTRECPSPQWAYNGTVTVTPNYAAAPDGTMTAIRVVSSAGYSNVQQMIAAAANTTYTYAVWVRPVTLVSGASIGIYDDSSATFVSLPLSTHTAAGEWRRVSVTRTLGGSATNIRIYLLSDGGAGGSELLVWAPQMSASAMPTRYREVP